MAKTTPEIEYLAAMNFQNSSNEPANFMDYLKQLNDKTFVYPMIVMILFLIILVIVILQRKLSYGVKLTVGAIYGTALAYTGYTFWPNI